MKLLPLSLLALFSEVKSLHIVQILDSVVLETEEYLELRNFNEASSLSGDSSAFAQEVMFGITNNFENFKYDVFFFQVDEQGYSADLDCYR